MSKTKTKAKQQIKTNVRKITLFVFLLEEKIAFCSITLIVSYLVFKSLINLEFIFVCGISSVKSSVVSDSLQTHGLQYTSSLWTSPTLGVYSDSCPLSRWCHPTISSSVVPVSSCPQSCPASGSFQMRQLFPWGSQSTGVSALVSVLAVNTQDWFPLGWTGWISLQSKGLSRVFSNNTVQKHQFFSAQFSL